MDQKEWIGLMTLPMSPGLGRDNSLFVSPASVLRGLRRETLDVAPRSVSSGEDVAVSEADGRSIEIELEIDPGTSRECGFTCFALPTEASEHVYRSTTTLPMINIVISLLFK